MDCYTSDHMFTNPMDLGCLALRRTIQARKNPRLTCTVIDSGFLDTFLLLSMDHYLR